MRPSTISASLPETLKFHLQLRDGLTGGGEFAVHAAALLLHLAHGDAGAGRGFGKFADFVLADDQLRAEFVDQGFDFFLLNFECRRFFARIPSGVPLRK